jgi:enterochelin esterase-like enzyme
VTFRYRDTRASVHAVILFQEVAWPRHGPEFAQTDDGLWEAELPRPDVDRMEYLIQLLHTDGGSELVCDPANPKRAPGAFGEKSVLEFPEYVAPSWLDGPEPPRGVTRELDVPSPALGRSLPLVLWSSAGSAAVDRLPLLVVHDGVEYARFSDLALFLDRMRADGLLPPMRAALLHPLARDEDYSASPAYAEALARDLISAVHRLAPIAPGRRMRVGMGASLGALAMLHAHRLVTASFGGLFLQSGSFFHHRFDRHEMAFENFQRIRRFMDLTHAERRWDSPVPVTLTCGRVEMNYANNRAIGLALRAQGYPVRFLPVRDAHNWVGWRDAFVPGLVDLLRSQWA